MGQQNKQGPMTNSNHISGNKLRTYHLFKTSFQYEKYLDFMQKFNDRRLISKLRTSAHRLEIEVGRYKKPQSETVPVKDRLCKQCSQMQIEDEKHALLECPAYAVHRDTLFTALYDIAPTLSDLTKDTIFSLLMQCRDYEITNLFVQMLHAIQNIRGTL